MARRVFFSFHYERDVWRANQVRHSWVTKPDRDAAGFWDAAEFEKVKKQGPDAIKRWTDKNLEGTSVTVVLAGAETSERPWVKYEIERSLERGNGLLCIRIHNMKDQDGNTDAKGDNPLDNFTMEQNRKEVPLSQIYPTYDWVNNDGYENIGDWVEQAYLISHRPELEPPSSRSASGKGCIR
jgi:hypothetical protein